MVETKKLSRLPVITLGSVVSLLASTIYQENCDRNHSLWNTSGVDLRKGNRLSLWASLFLKLLALQKSNWPDLNGAPLRRGGVVASPRKFENFRCKSLLSEWFSYPNLRCNIDTFKRVICIFFKKFAKRQENLSISQLDKQ